MKAYYRPVLSVDAFRPSSAQTLAGGWTWFDRVERITREGRRDLLPVSDVPDDILELLTTPRTPTLGFDFCKPRTMGILNITPDSFSDGGEYLEPKAAIEHARELVDQGSDIIDIGAESTRPGAEEVEEQVQMERLAPCIEAVASLGPFSVDTRLASVAQVAMQAGAAMVNDVSGLSYDRDMVNLVAHSRATFCMVHSRGLPQSMQVRPTYTDVVLDVYDALSVRLALAMAHGIPRERIVIDPGFGFGKSTEHNLALLRNIALFHTLGCPLLVGISRKSFVGEIGQEPSPKERLPGTLAIHFAMLNQGVQMLRVHDVADLQQAKRLWQAMINTNSEEYVA